MAHRCKPAHIRTLNLPPPSQSTPPTVLVPYARRPHNTTGSQDIALPTSNLHLFMALLPLFWLLMHAVVLDLHHAVSVGNRYGY